MIIGVWPGASSAVGLTREYDSKTMLAMHFNRILIALLLSVLKSTCEL